MVAAPDVPPGVVQASRLLAADLTLAYGSREVVHALSASIPDGKVTSIVGPNGCGKSTLLRALARLHGPEHGSVYLDGQAIRHFGTKEVARRLGLLAQRSSTPEAITVEDLVRRGRYPHRAFFQQPTARDRDAVEHAMELAGVTDLRRRSVDELSGGQRQRAWIAMVLAQETPLMLMDEPTTYLDIAHQQEVFALVNQLARESGRTIVMVLHDVNEASRISDHVIAMRAGEIVASGTPSEVITPERMQAVFGVACDVVTSPIDGKPLCLPHGHGDDLAGAPQAAEKSAMRAVSLSLGYQDRQVVRHVDVSIPAGRVTAIIGPNACGKSTLLKGLARLLTPSAGTVYLDETSIRQGAHRDFAQRVGLLGQGSTAPPGETVRNLVAGGRYPYQRWFRQWTSADADAVEHALEATHMKPFRWREMEALSGGQAQRAWVAMTLAQGAPTMLLDEPTTFLDIAHQVEVLDLVRDLNLREGRTVVMVLHDLSQACRYADHIVAMVDGRIAAAGRPSEIVTESLVREVFGIESHVIADARTGRPLVVPRRSPSTASP